MINISKILLVVFIILFSFTYILKIFEENRQKLSNYKKGKISLAVFRDNFYRFKINNFYITYFCCFIYIFSAIMLFILLRLLVIGETTILSRENISHMFTINNLTIIIINYLLFILCIIYYKNILNRLLFKYIIKLRIYLNQSNAYQNFRSILLYKFTSKLLGFLWCYFYRIASLTFGTIYWGDDSDVWFKQQIHDEEYTYKELYENKYIIIFANFCMFLVNQHNLISFIFYKMANLCRLLYALNSNDFFKFLPYTLLAIALLYDVYNKQLHYTYSISFISLLVIMVRKYCLFENKLNLQHIMELCEYFYLKKSFYGDFVEILYKKRFKNNICLSLFNNFEEEVIICTEENKRINFYEKVKYMKIHLAIIIVIIYLLIYQKNIMITFCNHEISNKILFISIILFLFYIINKSFSIQVINENSVYENFYRYYYNYKYDILSWIIIIISLLFAWLILIKSEFTFMDNEIIIKLPYDFIRVIKVYNQEEKILFFKHIFEEHLRNFDMFGFTKQDLDNIRLFVNELNLEHIIGNNTSFYDIRNYINELLTRYKEHFFNKYEIMYLESLDKEGITNYLLFYIKTKRFLYKYWKGGNAFFNSINEHFIIGFVNITQWDEILNNLNPFILEDLFNKYVEEQANVFLLNYLKDAVKYFAIILKIMGDFTAKKLLKISNQSSFSMIKVIIKYIFGW